MTTIAVPADATRVVPADAVDATIAAVRRVLAEPEDGWRPPACLDHRVRLRPVDPRRSLVYLRICARDEDPDIVILGVFDHEQADMTAAAARLRVHSATGVPFVETSSTAGQREAPMESVLGSLNVSRDSLVNELGLCPHLAEQALACVSQDRLLHVAAQAPQRSQGETIRLLAAGSSTADVRDLLELTRADPATADTDDVVHAALRGRASRMNYALLDGDEPGDLEWMLRGVGRDEWRAFLHPAQRRYVEGRHRGPALVTGGPGTGKTVVLIHRARELSRRYPGSRIVLTTYTSNLAEALRRDVQRLDATATLAPHLGAPGIYVTGIESLVRSLLERHWKDLADSAGGVLGSRHAVAGDRPTVRATTDAWKSLIRSATGLPGAARYPEFFQEEYESVILPQALMSEEGYLRVKRAGRGVSLNLRERSAVWQVIADYRRRLRADSVLDFAEAAAVVAHHLSMMLEGARPVDHVLIDEAQDLSTCHWRLMRAMTVPGADDVFVAADAHQRIYARSVRARDIGMAFPSVRTLDLSYRTTEETLQWALGLLGDESFQSLSGDSPQRTCRSTRAGEHP